MVFEPLEDLLLKVGFQGWVDRPVLASERPCSRNQLHVVLDEGGRTVHPVEEENFIVRDISPLALVTQQLALVQRKQLLYMLAPLLEVALSSWPLLPVRQGLGVLLGSILGEMVQSVSSRVAGC